MDSSTQQGLAALKAGNKSLARTLFRKAIQQNHEDTQAWLGLSAAVESDFEKVQCLQTILKIDPNHKIAKTALDQLVGRLFHGDELNLNNPNLGSIMNPESHESGGGTLNSNSLNDTIVPAQVTPPTPTRPQNPSNPDPFDVLRSRYAALDNPLETPTDPTQAKSPQVIYPEKKSYLIVSEEKTDQNQEVEVIGRSPDVANQAAGKKTPNKNQWIRRILLVGGGVLAAFLLVALLVIFSGSIGLKGTPTPEFMGVAKPILASELTQTATHAKLAIVVPTKTPLPSIPVTKTPLPSPTYALPNRAIQARFNIIQNQIAEMRGLPIIKGNVPGYPITKLQAQEYFKRYVSGENFAAQLESRKKALMLLGLVSPSFDMFEEVINQRVDPIGGFYSPENQELFLVSGLGVSGSDFMIYAHEFDHALIDQNFNIRTAGVYPKCKFDSQHCRAIEALFEGDAELIKEKWARLFMTPKDISSISDSPEPFYTPENQALPPYLTQDVTFPYTYGKQFVRAFFQSGGWSAVDKLYGRLPISTTQIMHPDKYIINAQPVDMPDKAVGQRLAESWSLINDDSLGEWATYLMFAYNSDRGAQVETSSAKVAASGWNGDHYQIFENKVTRSLAMSAHWTFDTSPDLGEFSNTMKLMLETRYRGNRLEWTGRDCWLMNGQVSCYFAYGKQGLWLLGPDKDTISTMLSAFPDFPQK